MTARKSTATPAATATGPGPEAAADVVLLHSKDLGLTKEFAPAHAKALLAYQESKGYSHWAPPAAEEAAPSAE